VDHPLNILEPTVRPWRTATLVACGIAAVELVLLVIAGSALIARHSTTSSAAPATHRAAAKRTTHAARRVPVKAHRATAVHVERGQVGVLVLNGNGRPGAAADAASRVRRLGYPIRSVGNARSMSYARSIVMYRPGYEAEGRRLGRELGIRIVGPLDGLRTKQLHGAKAVVIVGG
jgi:hypothetical protein